MQLGFSCTQFSLNFAYKCDNSGLKTLEWVFIIFDYPIFEVLTLLFQNNKKMHQNWDNFTSSIFKMLLFSLQTNKFKIIILISLTFQPNSQFYQRTFKNSRKIKSTTRKTNKDNGFLEWRKQHHIMYPFFMLMVLDVKEN